MKRRAATDLDAVRVLFLAWFVSAVVAVYGTWAARTGGDVQLALTASSVIFGAGIHASTRIGDTHARQRSASARRGYSVVTA